MLMLEAAPFPPPQSSPRKRGGACRGEAVLPVAAGEGFWFKSVSGRRCA